jgi:16S rRNA (cytosine1402-N4)-methyltransferase
MNGVLFDLGVSSLQLDKPERGFSFMREGELDMRFDNSYGMSAKEWINTASEKELADVFYFLGEERKSRQFAKKIIHARKDTNISSTKNLAELFKPKGFQKKHPATNIFRGIRILINNEFEELKEGLISAIKVLKDRGILAVISFHSAEDRIVKNFFKKDYKNFFEGINLKNVNKIKPSKEEISTNPRSRSAILRIGEIEYVS